MSQSDNSDASFTMYCVEETSPPTALYLQSDAYLMQIREHNGSDTADEDVCVGVCVNCVCEKKVEDNENESDSCDSETNSSEENDDDSDDLTQAEVATQNSNTDIHSNNDIHNNDIHSIDTNSNTDIHSNHDIHNNDIHSIDTNSNNDIHNNGIHNNDIHSNNDTHNNGIHNNGIHNNDIHNNDIHSDIGIHSDVIRLDEKQSNTRGEYIRWADVISDSDCEEEYWDPIHAHTPNPRPLPQNKSDEFIDEWDVWYDSPKTNLSKKGMFRDEFEGSLRCLARIRSMKDMNNLFLQFGERLELIPVDGTVAVCREGVKPVWEDASHSDGGRLKVRKFPHDLSEVFFRKLLNVFVHQELPFFEYLTCVSLQVKSQIASQKADVLQIWHSRFPSRVMSAQLTKHIRALLASEPCGYNAQGLEIYGLENHTAVARNDVKLSQAGLKLAVKQKPTKINEKNTNLTNRNANKQKIRQPVQTYGNNTYTYNGYTIAQNHKQNNAVDTLWQPKSKKQKSQKNAEVGTEKKPHWRENSRVGQRGAIHMKTNKSLSSDVLTCDTDTPVATHESKLKLMHFNSQKWSADSTEREVKNENRHCNSKNRNAFNAYGGKNNNNNVRGNLKKELVRKKDRKQWPDETHAPNEPSGYYVNGCWYPSKQQ